MLLWLVARHDGLDITGPPWEVVLDKSVCCNVAGALDMIVSH